MKDLREWIKEGKIPEWKKRRENHHGKEKEEKKKEERGPLNFFCSFLHSLDPAGSRSGSRFGIPHGIPQVFSSDHGFFPTLVRWKTDSSLGIILKSTWVTIFHFESS